MLISYDPDADAVYVRVAESTGPATTEVLESGVAMDRSAGPDGRAYGFEFLMVKLRGLPTSGLPADVALAIEEGKIVGGCSVCFAARPPAVGASGCRGVCEISRLLSA